VTKLSLAGYPKTFVVFEYFGQLTNDPVFERRGLGIGWHLSFSFVIPQGLKSRFGRTNAGIVDEKS